MEKIATPPPLLAGYADAAAQESVRNVCLIHAGRKFREKLNDLFKNLRPKCLNSRPLLCEEGNVHAIYYTAPAFVSKRQAIGKLHMSRIEHRAGSSVRS